MYKTDRDIDILFLVSPDLDREWTFESLSQLESLSGKAQGFQALVLKGFLDGIPQVTIIDATAVKRRMQLLEGTEKKCVFHYSAAFWSDSERSIIDEQLTQFISTNQIHDSCASTDLN